MSVLRRTSVLLFMVVLLPLLGTICIAWSNDTPTTLLGLARSVCFWQAFFWAGSLLMAFMVALVFLVRTGRVVVVAGDCDETPSVIDQMSASDVGIHPVTGNMTIDGFDVATGYSTANYPSHTLD